MCRFLLPLRLVAIHVLFTFVVSDTEVDEQVATCMSDSAKDDDIDLVLNAAKLRDNAGSTAVPGVPGDGNPLDWFSNVVPPSFDSHDDVLGLPPSIEMFGYRKWTGFDLWWLLFIGMDPSSSTSSDPLNTVFGTNLEDRGSDNLMKRQYMGALTCDKLPHYQGKLDLYLDKFVEDIGSGEKGVLGSWSQRSLELFMDIHLGDDDPPEYVKDFMKTFVDLQAPGSTPYVGSKIDDLKRGACLSAPFRDYVASRLVDIRENELNDTFVFHWDYYGLPEDAIVAEIVHNFLAWGQFVNILMRVIRAKLQGYESLENVNEDVKLMEPIDFFEKLYFAGSDPAARLDVAREAFRLLLPAGDWFSQLQDTETPEGTFPVADHQFRSKTSMHFPLYIQALNDNYDPLTGETDVSKYDTTRYGDFQGSSCPFNHAYKSNVNGFFMHSSVDGETVVPKQQEEFYPVFNTAQMKYCPFGLGYRRCPSELFNLFMLQNLLDKLNDYEFRVVPPNADLFELLSFGDADFADGIPLGKDRARDNIFVDNIFGLD